MTPEQVKAMTNEALRLKVAELCGFCGVHRMSAGECVDLFLTIPPPIGTLLGWRNHKREYVPDYPNDLNAMHVAEKTMNRSQWCDYWGWLSRIVPDKAVKACHFNHSMQKCCSATARQRCEAFMLTMEKS